MARDTSSCCRLTPIAMPEASLCTVSVQQVFPFHTATLVTGSRQELVSDLPPARVAATLSAPILAVRLSCVFEANLLPLMTYTYGNGSTAPLFYENVSTSSHAPTALHPENETAVPVRHESERFTEPIWTKWQKRHLCLIRESNSDSLIVESVVQSLRQLSYSAYTLYLAGLN
jgi:hypothetical protein